MSTANRSRPPGGAIPVLSYGDPRVAAAWLCRAFGFQIRLRIGNHRIQLVHRGTALVVHEGQPGAGPHLCHAVLVPVDDADAHCRRALEEGAVLVRAPSTEVYGERQYTVTDPEGHRWTFTQTVADVDPATWGGELLLP